MLLATGLIRYRVRGRRALTAWVMTVATSSAVDPRRASTPVWAVANDRPTAALYGAYGSSPGPASPGAAVTIDATATSFQGVRTGPGSISTTSMPNCATSIRSASLSASTAYLD